VTSNDLQAPSPALRRNWALIGVPVALALTLRIVRLLETPNLCGPDPAIRALFAEKLTIYGWGELYASTTWAPAHFWLLRWGQWLGGTDPQLGARSVGVLLGALMCWPAFLIARRSALLLWQEAPASASSCGVLAAVLVAIEPLGLRFSTLTFAEVPATFFLLAGCAALLPDEREHSARWWLAVPCMAMACGLRYESWLLAPLLLLCRNLKLMERLTLCVACGAPAALWIIERPRDLALNALTREHMSNILPSLAPDRLADITATGASLIYYSMPFTLPLAAIGLFVSARRSNLPILPGATITALVVAPGSALFGHLPLMERYLVLPISLLTISAAVGATASARWWSEGRGKTTRPSRYLTGLLSLILISSLLPRTTSGMDELHEWGEPEMAWIGQSPGDRNPGGAQPHPAARLDELENTARMLAHVAEMRPGSLIYIEPISGAASYLYWRASIAPERIAGFYHRSTGDPVWREDLLGVLRGWPTALFVLQKEGGEGAKMFGLPGAAHPCERIREHRAGASQLRCLDESKNYRVFEASPVPPSSGSEGPPLEPRDDAHQEKESPPSKDSDATSAPTW